MKKSKIAIIGSRTFNDYEFFKEKLANYSMEMIISGGAKGTDSMAHDYSQDFNIPITVIKPNWKLGKHAGLLRNIEIIDLCDFVIAFWNGNSKGTKQAVDYAKKIGKEVIIYEII